MRTHKRSQQAGFTLVEMLVVIVIIGILAGLLLPAIGMVRRRTAQFNIAMDLTNLDKSAEAYKLKHSDYPPNFRDVALLKRHILKAWPKIDRSELDVLEAAITQAGEIDAAEALVFWFGGFSSDAKRPFTGSQGPFLVTGTAASYVVSANPARGEGVFAFDQSRLDYTDDGDIFPVYPPKGRKAPYVYFDSRTYSFLIGTTPSYTLYSRPNMGTAAPYKSNRPNATFNALIDPPDQMLEFAKPKTFQFLSAGLDDHYGTGQALEFNGLPASYPTSPHNGATLPVFLNYISNQGFFPHASPGIDPRIAADFHYGHLDNIGNFTGGSQIEDVEE